MSTKHDDGGPAFAHGDPTHGGSSGMSLRDWFAGQALSGMVTQGYLPATKANSHTFDGFSCKAYALKAYELADAMLAVRS